MAAQRHTFLGADLRQHGFAWAALWLVALACLPHRYYFIFRLNPPARHLSSDMAGYVDRAWRLVDPSTTPDRFDAFFPPGTHVLLAPLFALTPSRLAGLLANQWLWWALAVINLWAVGLIALKLFKHPAAGALAVVLLLNHVTFTTYSGFFSSECPYACFLALALLAGLIARDMKPDRPGRRAVAYAAAGLLAGVAMTIRPQLVLTAAVIAWPLLRRRAPFVRIREALGFTGGLAVPCLLAMALNSHAAGTRVGLSENFGLNFYQGHCDVVYVRTYQQGRWMKYATSARRQRMLQQGRDAEHTTVFRDHAGWDSAFFVSRGWACIRADGWSHARRIYDNVADLLATTNPWPANLTRFAKLSTLCNRLYCTALWILIPMGVLLARRRRAERFLLAALLSLLPVAIIVFGTPRLRVPYDILGILLLTGLIGRLGGWRADQARPDRRNQDQHIPAAANE